MKSNVLDIVKQESNKFNEIAKVADTNFFNTINEAFDIKNTCIDTKFNNFINALSEIKINSQPLYDVNHEWLDEDAKRKEKYIENAKQANKSLFDYIMSKPATFSSDPTLIVVSGKGFGTACVRYHRHHYSDPNRTTYIKNDIERIPVTLSRSSITQDHLKLIKDPHKRNAWADMVLFSDQYRKNTKNLIAKNIAINKPIKLTEVVVLSNKDSHYHIPTGETTVQLLGVRTVYDGRNECIRLFSFFKSLSTPIEVWAYETIVHNEGNVTSTDCDNMDQKTFDELVNPFTKTKYNPWNFNNCKKQYHIIDYTPILENVLPHLKELGTINRIAHKTFDYLKSKYMDLVFLNSL